MSFRGSSVILALIALLASTVISGGIPPSSARAGVVHDLPLVSPAPTDGRPRAPLLTGSVEAMLFVEDRAQKNDDGPDVLLMALLTVGAAAGATVLTLIGYVIRHRIGFWLHRPPPRDDGAPEEHQ